MPSTGIGPALRVAAVAVAVGTWWVALTRLGGVRWEERYLLAGGLTVAMILAALGGLRRRLSTGEWLAVAVGMALLAALLGAVGGSARSTSDGLLLYYSLWASYFVARWTVGASERALGRFVSLVVLTGAVQAALGWLQFFDRLPTPSENVRIATGTFFNRNHFAGLLGMVFPLSLGLAMNRSLSGKSGVTSLLGGLAGVSVAVALVFSRSRGGILTMLVVSLVTAALFWSFRSARDQRRFVALGAVVGVALLAGGVVAFTGVAYRFQKSLSEEQRWAVWSDSLQLIADHPVTGVGPGGYRDNIRRYQTLPTGVDYEHAHNDVLEIAADFGAPIALLVWAWILWTTGRVLRRGAARRDLDLLALGMALCAFIAHSMVEFQMQIPVTGTLFFALLGVASARTASDLPRGPRAAGAVAVGLFVVGGLALLWTLQPRWRAAGLLRTAETLEQHQEVVDIDPLSPDALFRLGKAKLSSLDAATRATAAEEMRLAMQLAPTRWDYCLEAARAFEVSGDLEGAREAYLRGLELNPAAAGYHWQWTNFLVRQGRLDEAVEAAVRTVESDGAWAGEAFALLRRAGAPATALEPLWRSSAEAASHVVTRLVQGVEDERVANEIDGDALLAIGRAAFEGSPEPPGKEAERLVTALLNRGEASKARRLWGLARGEEGWADPVDLVWNGRFELPLAQGGLGWSTAPENLPAIQLRPGGGLRLRPGLLDDRAVWLRQRVAIPEAGRYRLEVEVGQAELGASTRMEIDVLDPMARQVLAVLAIPDRREGRFATTFEVGEATASVALRLSRISESGSAVRSVFVLDSVSVRAGD